VLIEAIYDDVLRKIEDSQSSTSQTVTEAHQQTRDLIRNQGMEYQTQAQTVHNKTIEAVQSGTVEIQHTIEMEITTNKAEHANTQAQIAELRETLKILSAQINERDLEFKDLLTAFNKTKSSKKKRALGEKSNAVAAALYALETMYKSIQVSRLPN
jgi:hypothetical protein